ncbi:MAG: AlbA family DNA-binding domain-containing protein [Microcoleaceae cyanobacterium]
MEALSDVHGSLKQTSKAVNVKDRKNNVNKIKGLVDEYFVKKEPPVLRHGPGLALDLENSIRRSLIETSRYECKQGLLSLSNQRDLDQELLQRILQTICGIANSGPDGDGYLFIGVADKEKDAERVKMIDQVEPYEINGRYIVGVDREAKALGIDLEQYTDILLNSIRNSELSDPLKTQILAKFDTIQITKAHQVFSVIRITILAQVGISYLGDDAFVRSGSSTKKATAKEIASICELFRRS